jgi:hypothetical protein
MYRKEKDRKANLPDRQSENDEKNNMQGYLT